MYTKHTREDEKIEINNIFKQFLSIYNNTNTVCFQDTDTTSLIMISPDNPIECLIDI